jgi:Ca2+-binding RTX toxin-like protein
VPGQPFATELGDLIDGAGGADTMSGGGGDDVYFVDDAGDRTLETAGGGVDLVRSSITWTLSNHVENLELLTGALDGYGNSRDNTITGNAAGNMLDGGTGADTLVGGLGDDTYVVDNAGDMLVEEADGGTDSIRSSVTWTLGANFENLTLTGASAINGSGNGLDNWLTGNDGINTLAGGAGNDTYVVGLGDIVVEQAGQGTDTVRASVDFTLGANIENLVLTGTGDVNGTGNAGVNVLTGNGGANRLDGGAGKDTMVGGLGDDTYVVDSYGELVTEGVGEGTDTVEAWVSWQFEL